MSARHAALAIHALSDVDRQWMLERLPLARREALDPLLAELLELGIPRDARSLPPMNVPALPTPVASAALTDADWLARLPSNVIVSALEGELPEVIATLLSCEPWPWAGEVVAAFSVPVPLPLAVPAPRLREFVSRQLATRVRDDMQTDPMTSEAPAMPCRQRAQWTAWARLKQWAGRKS